VGSVRDLFIISHTHWDREWYRSRQQYRLQLLDVIDRLLDLMARVPAYKHFLLDGQTVMLEDYLALRPERVAAVRRLVAEGRLHIGPWYVQPDEFLVSGEALIRNLLFGEQAGQKLGGGVKVGWLPDTFGHVAQLPQLLRNFGIDNFIFSRGLGDQALTCPSAFWWVAPNGSRVLALHQIGGYWNAGNLGQPCFWGDTADAASDFEQARETLLDLLPSLDPKGILPALAVWNGADHTPPQSDLPQIIEYLDHHLGSYRVRHGSLQDYVSALSSDSLNLSTIHGELKESRYQSLLPGTLSSRLYLKQANHRAQTLLQSYAEPLSTLAWVAGSAYPAAELREAWRLLLQNHAHDSICGCNIDLVHREMAVRFEQVEQIGQGLVNRKVDALASRIDTAWCGTRQIPVLVFNPLPRPRSEAVQLSLRLPEGSPAFRVTDSEGQIAVAQVLACEREPYQWIPSQASAREVGESLAMWRAVLRDLHGVDLARYEWQAAGRRVGPADATEGLTLCLLFGDRHRASEQAAGQLLAEVARLPAGAQIRLEAFSYAIQLVFQANVPALGYATYAVEAGDTPPTLSALIASEREIENEHVRVTVAADGSLTVLHKATGQEYRGLHQFEETADVGDTYDFCPLPGSAGPTLLSSLPEVALIESGPLQAALRIHWEFEIPEALTADRRARSARQVALPVTSLVRLRAGSPQIEIATTLENHARDHRLRVRFPTGLSSQRILAGGHMASVSRPVTAPAGNDWVQPPSGLHPHQTWFAVDDDTRGLAVLSEGLPEHEALETVAGVTLALTLLRGVGWLSRGDLGTRRGQAGPALPTPDAQCLGAHSFRYGLLPYRGEASRTSLPQLASVFDAPLLASPMPAHRGQLPPRLGFVSLESEALVLSAVKRSETGDRLVLRCYNAAASRIRGRIRFGFAMAQAWQASAGEQAIRPIELEAQGAGCHLEIGPCEIVTLLLCPVELSEAT
jgi:mannosylglycerate hydrolase